ncbi:MAG TPA: carboxymuconolactone decarboxylase family protein [Niabella sp.]|nr:carboxymuconolactone decarboxylase family protein [Niabella sp.]
MSNTQTFLPPIEKPKGLMMKLVYYLTKRQLGTVITPVKVFSARLPIAFGMMGAKVYQLDKKLVLPKELIFLIRHQVARMNICAFCMDIGRYKAMKELMNEEKFNAISEYNSSPLFSDAEKAALDYAGELTKEKKVNPQTFSKMATYYSEREICEIVYLISSEHVSNITNIGLNIHSDMLCDISKRKTVQS